MRFYTKAAEEGHAESQYKMGIMKERCAMLACSVRATLSIATESIVRAAPRRRASLSPFFTTPTPHASPSSLSCGTQRLGHRPGPRVSDKVLSGCS